MKKYSWIILSAAVSLLIITSNNSAQDRRIPRERRRIVVKTHNNYDEIIVKEKHYYFRHGVFYEKGTKGYVVVTAPVGARIAVLPSGYRIIHRRRVTFYLYGGVYYQFIPREKIYVVVRKPF